MDVENEIRMLREEIAQLREENSRLKGSRYDMEPLSRPSSPNIQKMPSWATPKNPDSPYIQTMPVRPPRPGAAPVTGPYIKKL